MAADKTTEAPRPRVYRPRTAFVTGAPGGGKARFDTRTLVPEGHWVLEVAGDLFEPVEDAAERTTSAVVAVAPEGVEQATAAPGEVRTGTTRRRG